MISNVDRKVNDSTHAAISKALDQITYEIVDRVRQITGREVSVLEATRTVNSISNKIDLPSDLNVNIVAMVTDTRSKFMREVAKQATATLLGSIFNTK